MTETHFDLIALGLVAVDVLVVLPEQVARNGKQLVSDLIIQGGAPTGSGACGVARFGYRTGVVARLGRNTLSEIARDQFHSDGVSLDLCAADEHSRPAIALVEIDPDTAARTVYINLDDYGYVRPEDVPTEAIRKARVVLVDSYDLDATEAALHAAAGAACQTVVDFEGGDVGRLRKLLKYARHAVLPLESAQRISGERSLEKVFMALGSMTSAQLVCTDGINGSWANLNEAPAPVGSVGLSPVQILHQPAFRVDAKDSTGCGDAFHAGYIIGLLEGWSLALRMEFGAWLAARVATHLGGRTALPRRGEMRGYLRPDLSPDITSEVQRIGL